MQYNVSSGLVTNEIGPYPFTLGRERVSDDAPCERDALEIGRRFYRHERSRLWTLDFRLWTFDCRLSTVDSYPHFLSSTNAATFVFILSLIRRTVSAG